MRNTFLNKLKSLYRAEKYEEVLEILSSSDVENLKYPFLLVWKSRCLLLINENVPSDSLEQAELCLKEALEIDEDYLPAIVDLAYLKLNVYDSPNEAIHLFKKASEMTKDLVTEVVLGHAQCVAELNGTQQAISFLKEQPENLISKVKLEKFLAEICILDPE
jgi:lipopolysaccharide biosynthesis regulator YciM